MAATKASPIQNQVGLTGMLSQPKSVRLPAEVSVMVAQRLAKMDGKPVMMDAKIHLEIPLPIPCSVMSSPSHMRSVEPATMAVMAITHSIVESSGKTAVAEATTLWYMI